MHQHRESVMPSYGYSPHKTCKHPVLPYRFSEAMMAGCIPVFVGPPFPPLPLVDEVRYTAAAVFININEQSGWQKDAEEVGVSPLSRWTRCSVPRCCCN